MNYNNKDLNLFAALIELISRPFRNLGRMGRADYLTITFLYITVYIIVCITLLQIFSFDIRSKYFWILAQTAMSFLFIRLQIRRLHDVNLSGYWTFIYLISNLIALILPYASIIIGFIYGIIISIIPGTNSDNKYGSAPQYPSEYKILIATFVMLITLFFAPLIMNRLSSFDSLQFKEMLNKKITIEDISKK